MALGQKTGGRRKGSLNKLTAAVAEKLARLGCDPIEGMARLAQHQCPCPTCAGRLKARYSLGTAGPYLDPDQGSEMTCRTCWGTGKEPISPELRGRLFSELAQYIAPKRKAIDLSGPNGTAIRNDHRHAFERDYADATLEELQAELDAELAGGQS